MQYNGITDKRSLWFACWVRVFRFWCESEKDNNFSDIQGNQARCSGFYR